MKHLRLAKVSTLEGANVSLEKEYSPVCYAHFARPVADFPNQHRALTPQLDLAAILCHVVERVSWQRLHFLLRLPSLSDRALLRCELAFDASDSAWNSASTAN